jgi:hypothetical protein
VRVDKGEFAAGSGARCHCRAVRGAQALAFRQDAGRSRAAFASTSTNLAACRRKRNGDVSFEHGDRDEQK